MCVNIYIYTYAIFCVYSLCRIPSRIAICIRKQNYGSDTASREAAWPSHLSTQAPPPRPPPPAASTLTHTTTETNLCYLLCSAPSTGCEKNN